MSEASKSRLGSADGVGLQLRPGEAADGSRAYLQSSLATRLAVVILGPTGSGKTALSLSLAEAFACEIVSCDSVAIYRGMDVGTAKPSREERTRVPHHLIDVADPDETFTAGEYGRRARAALADIARRGRLPVVTGGTGLYLRALLDGLSPVPGRQQQLRMRLERSSARHGSRWLHRILQRLDPLSATRIHANDTPKSIRAIEVTLAAGRPMSAAQSRDPLQGFNILRIGLNPPRTELYDRLNLRAAAMFESGLVDETRALVSGFGRGKALEALGYRQAAQVLEGSLDVQSAIAAAQQAHRNYAKRQMSWFRREPEVHWFHSFGDEAGVQRMARELVSLRI